MLDGKRVLVTGATGFLGGRLVERLYFSNHQINVRGLVHNSQNMSRLARLPVEMAFGDMTSINEMRHAVHGCDIVIHCAYGNPYDSIKGTECIIKASIENDIKKFIHISSVAVYGYSPSAENVEKEKCDYHPTNDYYCDRKIALEKIAFSHYESSNFPLVILRPGNIFGPYSKPWTLKPISMLRDRCYVLVNGGYSPSNAVYVDNIVDAIELAIEQEDAIGHALNISSEQVISWRLFFTRYANMFEDPPPVLNLNLEEVRNERARYVGELLKRMLCRPRQIPAILPLLSTENKLADFLVSMSIRPEIRNKIKTLNSSSPKKTKIASANTNEKSIIAIGKVPDRNLLKIFTLPFQFPIRNATKVLGYKSRFSFEDGMKLTEKWLKYQRLVCD